LSKLKGKVYATCLIHGSETWPMKVEHELKMNRTEMSMIRWMCGVKLNERKKSEELRELLGLETVSLMIKKSRLRWFGHVEGHDTQVHIYTDPILPKIHHILTRAGEYSKHNLHVGHTRLCKALNDYRHNNSRILRALVLAHTGHPQKESIIWLLLFVLLLFVSVFMLI